MRIAFLVIMLVFSFLAIILIYLQSGKVRNIGSSIVGVSNSELFEVVKKRGSERIMHYATIVSVFLFFLFGFLLIIV